VGHHFARRETGFGPRFQVGFTDRQLSPFDEEELLKSGCGITNVVPRAKRVAIF